VTTSPNGSNWEAVLRALAEAQAHADQRFAELAEAEARADERVAALAMTMERLAVQMGEVRGWIWEERYRRRAPAYFGRILRRIHVLAPERLSAILDDAVAAGRLSEAEADEVERAGPICRGRRVDDGEPAYLVVEVSAGVGPSDVERAARRAALLARTGTSALAAVAGQWVTREARELAQQLGVRQIANGPGGVNPPA
jgi:hypothetical protein